jgi:type IX secretion system PorP/SprF family membrane protein
MVIGVSGYAQQDPLYALYMNNPITINPAMTGVNDNLTINLGYRTQWASFEGNPTTMAASGHISLRNNKMGAGALLINDRIGETINTGVSGLYAYKIDLNNKVFSFGMQGGMINYKSDAGQLYLRDPDDLAFAPVNETQFNLGAGIALKSEKYTIGLSVPRLMANSVKSAGQVINIYQQHVYAFGSYIYFLSDRILLKPSVLLKGVEGAPLSADLNCMVDINRNFAAGAFTRNFQSYGLSVQFTMLEKYRFAYVYEVPTNTSVGVQFSTHELMISFRAPILAFHSRTITNF